MDALEEGAQRAVLRVYRQMVDEMGERLILAAASGADFTAAHLAGIAMQVTGALEAFEPAAAAELEEGTTNAMATAVRQTARELLVAEMAMPEGTLRTLLVDNLREWAPQIPVGQVARLAEGQRLLVQGLAADVRATVGDSLAASVTQGKGAKAAARALRTVLTESHDWQLERIARTEINNSANIGHESTIQQAANRFPALDLSKKWSAARDTRACPTCLALQALGPIPRDQSFQAGSFTGAHPPAHPNCRCRVLAWSERWGTATKGGLPMSVATTPLAGTVPLVPIGTKNGPPPMPTKHDPLVVRVKELVFDDEAGTITGYASCWGDPMGKGDAYGHVVVKGAFLASINNRKAEGRMFPFLWAHGFRSVPIGVMNPADMAEDDKGLRFKAVLDIANNEDARKVYSAYKSGALDSFSIGWNPVVMAYPPEGSKAELMLIEVDLEEVSGVNFAADKAARLISVKNGGRDAAVAWLQELHAECKAGRVLSSANEEKLRQASELIGGILSTLPEATKDADAPEVPEPKAPEPPPQQQDPTPPSPPASGEPSEAKAALDIMMAAYAAIPKEA